MLFDKETYTARRDRLKRKVKEGLILLFGNNDAPSNYPANVYKYRQDSSFLYFYGQHQGSGFLLNPLTRELQFSS